MHFQRSNAWFSLRCPGTLKFPGDAAAAPEGDCVDAGQASQNSTIAVTHLRNTYQSEIMNFDSPFIPGGRQILVYNVTCIFCPVPVLSKEDAFQVTDPRIENPGPWSQFEGESSVYIRWGKSEDRRLV
jgi:hypothetical protein